MAFARPFAYNPGSSIPGTEQLGDLSIGAPTSGFTNNPQYWNGPDEDLGYVIAQPVSGNTQPTQLSGVTASVGFFRSDDLTEASFITLSETISGQSFANGNDAVTWLNNNGYWTSYVPVPVTPTNTPTNTPTRTPRPTVTPTNTPTNTPYPPNTYFFFRPEGSAPGGLTSNGQLEFTTNGASEVTYNPNITDEVAIYLTDKSGLYHPNYLDVVTYGGVLTMTQGSNTAILSGNTIDTGLWGSYGTYITGSYLEVVQASPNPFVSGSPINLVLTVNYPPTPTPTPTNTPTPTKTPIPVTGYAFNLVATPYNFPSAGNSIMNGPGGATSGSTDINALATGSRGFYFNTFDIDGIDRTDYFSGFTGQSVTITFNQTGTTAIYSGDTLSFKQWISAGPGSGFVFGANIGVPPSGTPSGAAVLIQSATSQFTIGFPVYVSLAVNPSPTPTPTPSVTNTQTPTPSVSPTQTQTPTNTITSTPTVTPTNPTLLQILNQTTGSRTVTSCTLDGVSQTLTSGTFPITAGNNGYALTHDASVLPNSIQFNFGGSGAFDLYSYKNGVLVNYLQSYNSSSYVAGGITLLTSDQLVLIITDPNALPTPTPTTTSTSTPTPSTTTTRTPTPTTTTTRTPTPTNTPSSGIDAIRAALSTSVAAYDAATVGNFIKVTQAEYTNVFATVVGATKYVMNDTDLNSAASGWATGYNVSYNDNINSIGSIPSNNYIIGYAYRGNSSGEVTTYLRTGTTANGTHTKLGANVNYTDTGAKTVYFIRKAPPTATTSKVYLSFFMNGTALGQVSGKTNYPIYYSLGIDTNTWTSFNGGYPTFQSLATTTKSW